MVVGSEKVKFVIYPDVLSKRSKFFESACSGRWNAEGNPIDLVPESPEVFGDYLNCVYQGDIDIETEDRFYCLIQLYVLADRLGDWKSANMVMDEMIASSDEMTDFPSNAGLHIVMENTTETSPLRQFIVDTYVYETSEDVFNNDNEGFPQGLLLAIAKEFRKQVKGAHYQATVDEILMIDTMDMSKCYCHQHDAFCPKCVIVDTFREAESISKIEVY